MVSAPGAAETSRATDDDDGAGAAARAGRQRDGSVRRHPVTPAAPRGKTVRPGGDRLRPWAMDVPGPCLLLRPLSAADEATARAAHDELALDGFSFLLDEVDGESWVQYVARLDRLARGGDVPQDRVPATFLVAEVGGVIVGRTSIRHRLNAYLATVGGHIGYGVRPRFRRRGYATEILQQSLLRARAVGIEQALVTCDLDNIGSATVIERCGGVLDGVVPDPGGGPPKRRYWITPQA